MSACVIWECQRWQGERKGVKKEGEHRVKHKNKRTEHTWKTHNTYKKKPQITPEKTKTWIHKPAIYMCVYWQWQWEITIMPPGARSRQRNTPETPRVLKTPGHMSRWQLCAPPSRRRREARDGALKAKGQQPHSTRHRQCCHELRTGLQMQETAQQPPEPPPPPWTNSRDPPWVGCRKWV